MKFISGLRQLTGWVLFVALCIATLALGANRPVSWTLLGAVVLLLAALTLLADLAERRPATLDRLWAPALLYAGVLTWGAIQILPGLVPQAWSHPFWTLVPDAPARISANPGQGLHILMRLACYGLVFWMALRTAAEPRAALRYLRAFAVFSMALAAYGIYADATGVNPLLGDIASNTVSASFANRNNYATFAAFGLVSCLALLLRASASWEHQRKRALAGILEGLFGGGWLWILGILLCGGAVMLTQSRGGAMAAMIGVIALLSTLRLRGGRAAIGPVLLFGLITLVVLGAAASGTVGRLLTTSDEAGRFTVYPAAWAEVMARPLLGHGLGAFETVFRASVPVEAAVGAWDKAHNSYLENALELGLPAALALYMALALVALQLLRGVMTRRRDRLPVCLAFACLLLATFHAFFDFSLQMPALAGFFAWLIGIGYAQSFPRSETRERLP